MSLSLLGILVFNQVFEVSLRSSLPALPALSGLKETQDLASEISVPNVQASALEKQVLPDSGVVLPVVWGDLGKKMIEDGVIDEEKFRALFTEGISQEDEPVLTGKVDEPLVMTSHNSRFILDMLWAFGLANKNAILETGEMVDEQYGGDASKFASTGGWSLAKGDGFDHYSKHAYVSLTPEQQALVDKVSRNIYRPCCGNSTHFPDCNHGMAMLGLLQLMAVNGLNETEMYETALAVNSIWFPQTYIDLATYFSEQGINWEDVDPVVALSAEHSSSRGYQETRSKIKSLPQPQQGAGGCGA